MRVRLISRRRSRRLSLLVRFAIVSLVLLAAVGMVLGQWLGHVQRDRSIADAVKSAQIVARAGIQPQITPDDLDNDFAPLDADTRQELDDAFGSAISSDGVVRLKVWNPQHWIVYSDNPSLVGRWFPGDEGLDLALAGGVSSTITDLNRPEEMEERDFGRLLAVYVPLRATDGRFTNDGSGAVVGAFEIYIPYAPVAEAIAADRRTLYMALAIGLAVLYLGLFRLVAGASRRLRLQAQLNAHQATHDGLTDLPNRRQLLVDLQGMLDRRYDERYVALALVDIDRFKEINDALGHPSGDLVLRAIAERFREQMPDATIARIGGDEFAIAAENLPHAQAALAVATRIEGVLDEPFEVAGIAVSVRPSIGIALGPDDGRDADELLQHADVAMYVAKRTGTVRRLYARTLDHYSPDRLSLAGELRDAIATASGEVHLAFQPKLSLRTDEVKGVECLVRWKHPSRGFVPPAEFLPIIENTELIAPLTWLVLDQALGTCATWRRHGLEIQMAVNISARTISSPELYDRVTAALEAYDLPASSLELEITESALLGDHRLASENVHRLRQLGVSIAIDDFGTGYASIGYLTTMPISSVKIDRSFVDRMFSDPAAAAVVNFSLGLGQQLGLEVVAEGVEDEPTLEELRRLGCDTAQGYFISRPLGVTEFLHWLLAWSTRDLTPGDIAPELDHVDTPTDAQPYTGSPYDLVGVSAAPPTSPSRPSGSIAAHPTTRSTGHAPSGSTGSVPASLPAPLPSPLPAPRPDALGERRSVHDLHQSTDPLDSADSLDSHDSHDSHGSHDSEDVDDSDDDLPVMPQLEGLGVAAATTTAPATTTAQTTTTFDDLTPLYERGSSSPARPASPSSMSSMSSLSSMSSMSSLSSLSSATPLSPPSAPPAAATDSAGPLSSRSPVSNSGPLLPALPSLSLTLRGSGSGSGSGSPDRPSPRRPTTDDASESPS